MTTIMIRQGLVAVESEMSEAAIGLIDSTIPTMRGKTPQMHPTNTGVKVVCLQCMVNTPSHMTEVACLRTDPTLRPAGITDPTVMDVGRSVLATKMTCLQTGRIRVESRTEDHHHPGMTTDRGVSLLFM